METSQNQNQDTEPTLAQAKAICAIRDRLWKYTRKSFRRFSEPRDAEALLLHLADLHEKLKRAEAEAVRVIPDDEIERCIKRRIELNAEIYAKRAKYVELGYQHFSTDAQSVREELARANQNSIERYQRIMEPDDAASIPIYDSQYQPRYWAQLCEAGLVHDGMIRDPAAFSSLSKLQFCQKMLSESTIQCTMIRDFYAQSDSQIIKYQ